MSFLKCSSQHGLTILKSFSVRNHQSHNFQKWMSQAMENVIKLDYTTMQERFDRELDTDCFIELDSSTSVKFSRHLIARADNACFRSNAHVGKFVEEMLSAQVLSSEQGSNRKITPGIEELFLPKDDTAKKACFIDRAVYTKNRAFRLMLSSKAGKDSVLQATGRLRPFVDMKTTFMESLICNVVPTSTMLTCFEGDPLPTHIGGTNTGLATNCLARQSCQCPFPAIEAFITSYISQVGPEGRVRSCIWWPDTSLLLLNITGNRYCANIGRQHKSNGVYYVVDLQDGVWFQKCYDLDCRSFRSEIMPLPPPIWQDAKDMMDCWQAQEQILESAAKDLHESKFSEAPVGSSLEAEGVLSDDRWPDEEAICTEMQIVEQELSTSQRFDLHAWESQL